MPARSASIAPMVAYLTSSKAALAAVALVMLRDAQPCRTLLAHRRLQMTGPRRAAVVRERWVLFDSHGRRLFPPGGELAIDLVVRKPRREAKDQRRAAAVSEPCTSAGAGRRRGDRGRLLYKRAAAN